MSDKVYVDIQSAIDAVCPFCCYHDYCGNIEEPCAIRKRLRERAASVAPVVRGEWIDEARECEQKAGRHYYRCNQCGASVGSNIGGYSDWWEGAPSNFCPNCGAAMSEEAVRMLKERSVETEDDNGESEER